MGGNMLSRCFVGTIALGLVVAAEAPAFAWSGSKYGNQPVVPPSVSASRCLHGQPVSFTSGGFSAGKTVTVKDNDEAVGSAPVGPDGVFSINVKMSHCGANRLTAVGTSPDGSTATVAAAVDGICGDVASAAIAGTAGSTSDANSGDANVTEVAPPAAVAGLTGGTASTSVAGTAASAPTTSGTPGTTAATARSSGAAGITGTSGPAGGTTSPVTATALPRTGSDVVVPAAVAGTALLLLGGTAVAGYHDC